MKKVFTLLLTVISVLIFAACSQEITNVADDSSITPAIDSTSEDDPELAPNFELCDQYGNVQKLSDYRGRVVFLNFWATWCHPCRSEMPDIQALYEKYGDDGEVAVLGVAFPTYNREQSVEGISAFLEENGYTYPVAMDSDASLIYDYAISAYPTTFMIDKDGKVFGYVTGALTPEMMDSIIEQTITGERTN